MYKILTLNKISETGLASLKSGGYAISADEKQPDAIIVRSADMHGMDLPGSLLAVARAGAGTNNIPIDKCTAAGVAVFNTPGANANAVKEQVIAALFLASRDIVGSINWAQSIKGQPDVPALVEKGKANFAGNEILGKRLGIIGVGAIGVLVAKAAVALGMDVIGVDPGLTDENKAKLAPEVKITTNEDEVLSVSDYLTVHIPYMPATKHYMNCEKIGKMKKGARLINFSRNEIVDNIALLAALESGALGRYVTDFPSDDLLGVKNVIPIPHLASSTDEAEENCAVMAAAQVKDYLETGNVKNSVNLPNVGVSDSGKPRVCVISKNSLTITNHSNGIYSGIKGGCAYTILLFDNNSDAEKLAAELMKTEGVIKVRIVRGK